MGRGAKEQKGVEVCTRGLDQIVTDKEALPLREGEIQPERG